MSGKSDLADRLGFGPATAINIYTLAYFLIYGCIALIFITRTGPAILFPACFLVLMLVSMGNCPSGQRVIGDRRPKRVLPHSW